MRISDWSSDVCSSDLRPHKDRRKSTSTTPCDPSASYGGTRDAAKSPRNAGGRCARKNHSGSRIWHRDQVAPPDTRHRRRVSTHDRSEEHTSELQSLMRISYAVFCLKKKKHTNPTKTHTSHDQHSSQIMK